MNKYNAITDTDKLKLQNMGFDLYQGDTTDPVRKHLTNAYLMYASGNSMAMLTKSISGYAISTIHKPCREAGTGFRVYDSLRGLPTEEQLRHGFIPLHWDANKYRKHVRPYSSVDEYLAANLHIEEKLLPPIVPCDV